MDQVGGEHPVALVHQGGQLGQAVAGGQEAFGLALDQCHVLRADGRRLLALAAVAGGEAQTEHGSEAEQGQAAQLLGEGSGCRRDRCRDP